MKLKNPSDRKVCFKIKTTAPKKYCVKPNSGVVDPSSEVQIAGRSFLIKHVRYPVVTGIYSTDTAVTINVSDPVPVMPDRNLFFR